MKKPKAPKKRVALVYTTEEDSRLVQYTAKKGLEVFGIFKEKGALLAQAERLQAIERVHVTLVAQKLSHLVSSVLDLCDLRAKGLGVATLDEDFDDQTAAGRFARNVFVALAEFQRETTSRTYDGDG